MKLSGTSSSSAPESDTGLTQNTLPPILTPVPYLLPNLLHYVPNCVPLFDRPDGDCLGCVSSSAFPFLMVKSQFCIVGLTRFQPHHYLRPLPSRVSGYCILELDLAVFL
ncbi:hypothetical protein E6O75_ATG05397 [Venturia nashicola]|uniref:Uncharacterized protein n=1 Tax=Venturia nashicola TaxID=86259 RepID=A0A4Z1NWW1_9PEZI|nr:hypothetical protein E6O75_ATG05397 [Venturia nashicola]